MDTLPAQSEVVRSRRPRPRQDEVVFLLGAGASHDAGLPLAHQLTSLTIDRVSRDPARDRRRLSRTLELIVQTVRTHSRDPVVVAGALPDIETIVSTVEMLQDRGNFELTPFVQGWDPALAATVVDSSDYSMLASLEAEGDAEYARTGNPALRDHARAVRRSIEGGILESDRLNELLNLLYRTLLDELALKSTAALTYSKPLVEMGRGTTGVTIATLNYDLAIETAAWAAGVHLSQGVETWEGRGVIEYGAEGIRLIKLHGSLDWMRGATLPLRGEPGIAMTKLELRPPGPNDVPFLVFGRREKLRPQGPFLALRAEFGRRLARAACLVVIGYSFADDHVNELIGRWVNSDQRRILIVVDPTFPSALDDASGFTRLLYSGLSKPPLIGPNIEGARLWVVRKSAAGALPVVSQARSAQLLAAVRSLDW